MTLGNRTKTGVIGAGGIFEGWGKGSGHLPGYPWLVDEVRLACVCDLSEKSLRRAEAAVKKLYKEKADIHKENGNDELANLLLDDIKNLKLYTDIDEMLKAEALNLVDIITPCEHHLGIAQKSLNAGCHVMCEKPLASTWLNAEEIVKEVEKTGKLFQYGENLIFADPYYDIRKLIQKDEIGELEAIWLPLAIGEPGNYSYTKAGIGSLLDMGIHGITLCWFLLGFDYIPKRVKSLSPEGVAIRMKDRLMNGVFKELTVEDDAHCVVEFENPVTGQWVNTYIEASWSYRDMQEFKVVGSNGEIGQKEEAIEVRDSFGNSRLIDIFHPDFLNKVLPPGYSGFPQQLKSMVTCVKEETKPLCNEKIGSESLAIAQAVYLSETRGRKAVNLTEFKKYAKKFNGKSEDLLRELLATGIRR